MINRHGFLSDARDLVKRTRVGRGADSGVSTCGETGRDRFSWPDIFPVDGFIRQRWFDRPDG